jgi:hypothetical protein
MILIKLKYGDQGLTLSFPCLHEYIRYRLAECGVDTEAVPKLLVESVAEPYAFSCLEGTYVNIDEINYLAKEIESLEEIQAEKLYAIIAYKSYKTPKELINAKFNLDCYTLVQDVRSINDIGRKHLSTLKGGLTQEELDTVDFAKIGRELLDSGKGIYTEYGILFRNEELEYKEVYDGQVFPEGWYGCEKHVLEVEIGYNGKSEYVYLPEEDLAIKKSLKRLGAPSLKLCTYQLKGDCFADREWSEKFKRFLDTDSILAVNAFTKLLNGHYVNMDKLLKLSKYVEAETLGQVRKLAEQIAEFAYISEIADAEDLGEYLTSCDPDYRVSEKLHPFLDHAGFGDAFLKEHDGRFIDGGCMYIRDGNKTLEELFKCEAPTDEPELKSPTMAQ